MAEVAAAQHEEIRRILLHKHLETVFSSGTTPKRPGSAPPQAELLPGSPMGAIPGGFNIISGERINAATHPAPAQPKESNELGLAFGAEEALRSRPDYVAYYYANVRNNPRLPPPLPAFRPNGNAPWMEDGKADCLAEVQVKQEAGDAHAQATFNLLFGSQLGLKDGTEPISIQRSNYLGQGFSSQVSSLGTGSGVSPCQHPDTLAAAWANIGGATATSSAAQQLDSLLGVFGSPRPAPVLGPLLTAELQAQASGGSLFSARSVDEQMLHDSFFVGSAPHTPMGSQHGGGNPLFGSFDQDSPRPSLDAVGRSISSKSLGAVGHNKERGGAAGRLADLRLTVRTPSKLRIGTTLADPDPQQQLLDSLTDADIAAATDTENAAVAAAQQMASAQVQAAVEAIQNLPPAAATAFAVALGGGDRAGVPGVGQQLMTPEGLLGGAGNQQQQVQAMYMAAMYPMYYAQQAQQAAGMQHSIQAMQAAAMAGFPVMAGAVPNPMLPSGYAASMLPGIAPGSAASFFGAGGISAAAGITPDVAALAAAGLRPPQAFQAMGAAAGGLMPQFLPGMMSSFSPSMNMCAAGSDYTYYQKMLEAQAAMAMAGGVAKDAETAAAAVAMLRGVPPPPPPQGQPPPPPRDKRNSGGEQHGPHGGGPYGYGHGADFRNGMGAGAGHGDERRGRASSFGRDPDRMNGRGSDCQSPVNGSTVPGGAGSMACSPTQVSGIGNNSRLRATSGPQAFSAIDGHSGMVNGHSGMGSGGGGQQGHGYAREGRGPEGPQRRNSQRRDMFGAVAGAGPDGGDAAHPDGGGGPSGSNGSNGPRGPRSSGDTLLDEFKANKTGRKYDLREILGHVYEFSLDQHGSRFIQQKLESVPPEELDAAFSEVLPRIVHLMTDVFGNYVVQKFLEHGSLDQRARLAKALHGHVLQLSLQMYGCRVVQKALEMFTEEQQVEIVAELDGHIMRCVRDQNGNHVIQKCIECVPTPRIIAVLDNFLMCVVPLSTHPFGCRIIQRILENVRDTRRRADVMADILAAAVQLTQDQYGNYVIQHVLERGTAEDRSSIAGSLASSVVQLSMHKFASNVVEKCLTYGSTADRDLLIDRMLGAQALQMQATAAAGTVDGDMEVEDPVQAMMKDQFGNYVVQKVLEVCSDEQRETMLARVRQQLHTLKRFTYGKHILARVEKLLSAGTRYQTHAKGRLLPDDEALAAAVAAAAAGRLAAQPQPPSGGDVTDSIVRSNGSSVGGEPAGSDGGSELPSPPTTPPVSNSVSDNGIVPGAPAPERPCSAAAGMEREGARLATGEAH